MSFLEDAGYEKSAIEKRVNDAWYTIFDSRSRNRFYFDAPDNTGFMEDTGNIDARTEGMSYGMMMAVQMDRKDIFDRLWKWARVNMYLDKGPNAGFFCWSNKTDGTKNADGPAPDGEEYFAMALFFASSRWGDGEGIFDYTKEARAILRTAVHGPSSMWNPDNYLIRFVCNCPFSDPSYHLPHFYELFALRADEADSAFWKKAAAASRDYLVKACHPQTGLAAEYAENDGTPLPLLKHGTFFSDSYRVAANIGLDALWNGKTKELSRVADNILRFFDGMQPDDFMEYRIDGKPCRKKARHPVGLCATLAEAALAAEDEQLALRAVRRFWDTPLREGKRRYYDNCLYFFALLALSGHYNNWGTSKTGDAHILVSACGRHL